MLFPNNADDCRTITENKFLHTKQVLLRLRKHSWSYVKLNNLLILIWEDKKFPQTNKKSIFRIPLSIKN